MDVLAQRLLLLYGSGCSIIFPFAQSLLIVLACDCVSVCVRGSIHASVFHAKTITFRYRFLHGWFFNRLSLCAMPSYDVSVWVCECARRTCQDQNKFKYRFLHKCCCYFMGFSIVFPFLSGVFLQCLFLCVCVCIHTCIHGPLPRPLGSDGRSCTTAAATLWVRMFNHLSLCTVSSYSAGLWVRECVSVCVCASIHASVFHAKTRTIRLKYRFLHKWCWYFMGLVFQSSFPLHDIVISVPSPNSVK